MFLDEFPRQTGRGPLRLSPEAVAAIRRYPWPTRALQLLTLREAERRHIEYVMRQVAGNKTRACPMLQIGRSTLYKRLTR